MKKNIGFGRLAIVFVLALVMSLSTYACGSSSSSLSSSDDDTSGAGGAGGSSSSTATTVNAQ